MLDVNKVIGSSKKKKNPHTGETSKITPLLGTPRIFATNLVSQDVPEPTAHRQMCDNMQLVKGQQVDASSQAEDEFQGLKITGKQTIRKVFLS